MCECWAGWGGRQEGHGCWRVRELHAANMKEHRMRNEETCILTLASAVNGQYFPYPEPQQSPLNDEGF